MTIVSTILQGLFLQHLHKRFTTVVYPQPSILLSLHDDVLHHLYQGIYPVVSLQPSLHMSLQDNILLHLYRCVSTIVSLWSSLLASLRSEFLQSSLFASLRSDFLRSSLLASLWNIFLRRLYRDISTVTSVPSKPEFFLQHICEFTICSIQAKPETFMLWLLLHASVQTSVLLFYKYIGYYMIDQTTNNTTLGYIMLLKRKWKREVKGNWCAKGRPHRECNNEVESSSLIVSPYVVMGSCLMNVMDYNFNYKLRSVVGWEDDFTANKWMWLDLQVRATLLWTWVISQALVDYTDMGRTIGRLLDDVQEPYVSANNSDGTITSYSHTSMVVHPGSNDHLRIRNLIHGNMLSLSLKKERNGKVSLKTGIVAIDYKMTINIMLMKYIHCCTILLYH